MAGSKVYKLKRTLEQWNNMFCKIILDLPATNLTNAYEMNDLDHWSRQ